MGLHHIREPLQPFDNRLYPVRRKDPADDATPGRLQGGTVEGKRESERRVHGRRPIRSDRERIEQRFIGGKHGRRRRWTGQRHAFRTGGGYRGQVVRCQPRIPDLDRAALLRCQAAEVDAPEQQVYAEVVVLEVARHPYAGQCPLRRHRDVGGVAPCASLSSWSIAGGVRIDGGNLIPVDAQERVQ
ncbi:MAG TPA: hypothetical protein ACQGQH_06025 [Xylella sp.]